MNTLPGAQAASRVTGGAELDHNVARVGRELRTVGLVEALGEIEPPLIRYPVLDSVSLRNKLEEALARV